MANPAVRQPAAAPAAESVRTRRTVEVIREVAPLVAVVGIAAGWAALVLHGCRPAVFWDTESYVSLARELARGIPPGPGLRMPLYPVFLALLEGGAPRPERVAMVQVAMWVVANGMIFLMVKRMTDSVVAGLVAALAAITFVDLLFMAITIYSEPLSIFVVAGAAAATVAALGSGATGRWTLVAGVLWLAASFVRPIFVVAAAVFVASVVAAAFARRVPPRSAVTVAAVVALTVLAWCSVSRLGGGPFKFSAGAGLSLLNYVGFPELHRQLPDDQREVRAIYARLQERNGDAPVAWWDAMPEIMVAETGEDGGLFARDAVGARVALRAIAAAPGGYLAVWRGAMNEYLSDVRLEYGWRATPDGDPQLAAGSRRRGIVLALRDGWARWLGMVTYSSLLLPLAYLALCSARRRRAPRATHGAWPLLSLWAILVAMTLLSTAIEPWPGQARYRYPLQQLHLAVLVVTIVFIAREARQLVPRPPPRTSRRET